MPNNTQEARKGIAGTPEALKREAGEMGGYAAEATDPGIEGLYTRQRDLLLAAAASTLVRLSQSKSE